jgi:hypothetical protein
MEGVVYTRRFGVTWDPEVNVDQRAAAHMEFNFIVIENF